MKRKIAHVASAGRCTACMGVVWFYPYYSDECGITLCNDCLVWLPASAFGHSIEQDLWLILFLPEHLSGAEFDGYGPDPKMIYCYLRAEAMNEAPF